MELWPSAIVRFGPGHGEVTVRPSVFLRVESYENWYTPPKELWHIFNYSCDAKHRILLTSVEQDNLLRRPIV
eukprot:scaffold136770_cov31-Attheya_sp.AAC.1